MDEAELDNVGFWTEIKLAILREYAAAYATILSRQDAIKHYAYIDGFAGAGSHIAERTGDVIDGSPRIALAVQPPFSHYHFIDLSGQRIQQLSQLAVGRTDVSVYQGDCNQVLLERVFPTCRYEDFRRAICLLDPYDLNPSWEVVREAGTMKSVEIFLNFMIMDANRNVLRKDPKDVAPDQFERMTRFWGDESWRETCYASRQRGLFDDIEEKQSNRSIAMAYRRRLQEVAGFAQVPEPLPMMNSKGAVIYYLFFASNNAAGAKIARDIFRKYKTRGL